MNSPSGCAEAGASGIGSRVGQFTAVFVGPGCSPSSRPARTRQAKTFASCMLTFASATSEVKSLALPPTVSPAKLQ